MSGDAQQLRAATFRRDDAGPEWVQDRGIACRRYWQITDDADPGIFVKIDIRTYNHIIQILVAQRVFTISDQRRKTCGR